MKRVTIIVAVGSLLVSLIVAAQPAPTGPEARDMALVGFNDLQGRSAYQPVIREQNGRFILYVGHHGGTEKTAKPVNALTGAPEFNGTSILDVTDPHAPRYLVHIPGEEGLAEAGGAQMVRVCGTRDGGIKGDPNKFYLLRTFGNAAHEIFDVTDPSAPKLVARIGPLGGTHKNWWECDTGVAYLVSGASGWRTRRMTQVTIFPIRRIRASSAISVWRARNRVQPVTCRRNCTGRSRPGQKATASTSGTARTRTAWCRSSTDRSS